MPRGVGIDPPSLGAGIQNVGQWARTGLLNHSAGLVEIVDEEIEMRVLLPVLTGLGRRSIARHTVEGEATHWFPAECQPVGITFRLGEVEDLLPEPGQLLGVVALQDELGQLAHGHASNLRASPPSALRTHIVHVSE